MSQPSFPASLTGQSFMTTEVVQHYRNRPPYPQGIYDGILRQAHSRDRLLDLGCGEGKVARQLAPHFCNLVAVDPSRHMIDLGKALENGQCPNIEWIESTAEDAPLSGSFDVVTFASSIHWMDPKRLFNKLKAHLSQNYVLAIISGDEPHDPPWAAKWQSLLAKWVPIATGRPMGSSEWNTSRIKHLDYADVVQVHDYISEPFRQSVDGFISCQHSRDTFAIRRLNERLAEFQKDVRHMLEPYADPQGIIEYRVKTSLTVAKLSDPLPS